MREEGNILLGSDLSSLENRLKFHFQMPLDPEYVKAQMSDDFDPHLAIAVMAGLLTEDEMNFYKVVDGGFPAENYMTEGLAEMLAWSGAKKESEVKRIAKIRGIGKGGNYSCLPTSYLVNTASGLKPSEEVQVGDSVWGYDEATGERVLAQVSQTHKYTDAVTYKVSFGGVNVLSTGNHRWLCTDGNYRETLELIQAKILRMVPNYGVVFGVDEYSGTYLSVEMSEVSLVEVSKSDVFCLTTSTGNFEFNTGGGCTDVYLTGNCQYGAGAKTVARTTKTSLEVGKMIVEGYREMNWSIDVIASNTSIKKTSFGDFQLNPLNRIYYPLKTAKDRFSTLIQGSGSYVLDLWLMFQQKRFNQAVQAGVLPERPKLLATYHDEQVLEFKEVYKDVVGGIVNEAIEDCNKAMKLNVDLACDIQFGYNYSEIH